MSALLQISTHTIWNFEDRLWHNHCGQFTFFQIWFLSEQTFFFMTTAMSRGMISYHHSQKTTLSHRPFSLHISRNDYNSIRMIHETLKELRCCYSSATQHTRLNSAELRPQNFTAISGKMMKYWEDPENTFGVCPRVVTRVLERGCGGPRISVCLFLSVCLFVCDCLSHPT
jgi:hypothetical protein